MHNTDIGFTAGAEKREGVGCCLLTHLLNGIQDFIKPFGECVIVWKFPYWCVGKCTLQVLWKYWFTKINYYDKMMFEERAFAPSECLIIVVF